MFQAGSLGNEAAVKDRPRPHFFFSQWMWNSFNDIALAKEFAELNLDGWISKNCCPALELDLMMMQINFADWTERVEQDTTIRMRTMFKKLQPVGRIGAETPASVKV